MPTAAQHILHALRFPVLTSRCIFATMYSLADGNHLGEMCCKMTFGKVRGRHALRNDMRRALWRPYCVANLHSAEQRSIPGTLLAMVVISFREISRARRRWSECGEAVSGNECLNCPYTSWSRIYWGPEEHQVHQKHDSNTTFGCPSLTADFAWQGGISTRPFEAAGVYWRHSPQPNPKALDEETGDIDTVYQHKKSAQQFSKHRRSLNLTVERAVLSLSPECVALVLLY